MLLSIVIFFLSLIGERGLYEPYARAILELGLVFIACLH